MDDWCLIFVRTAAPDVLAQPVVHLLEWRAIRMDDQLYLLGFTWETRKLRMTTHVQSMRRDRTAVTSSGRLYQLVGGPGDPAQALVWPELRISEWVDVTREVEATFDRNQ